MTKPKEMFSCKFCGTKYRPDGKKRYICSLLCALESRIDKSGECWIWTGSKHHFGYGEFRFRRKLYRAHSISYELFVGPIPQGYGVNHKCDNPACVNPAHLYAGTQKDNMQDVAKRMRNGNAKFSQQQIHDIRQRIASGETQSSIARSYNVRQGVIHCIAYKKTYAFY